MNLATDEIVEIVRREVIDPTFGDKSNWTRVGSLFKTVVEVEDARFLREAGPSFLQDISGYSVGVMPWDGANDAEYCIESGRPAEGVIAKFVISATPKPKMHRTGAVLGIRSAPSKVPTGNEIQQIADMM
jgi:hypothetical protein